MQQCGTVAGTDVADGHGGDTEDAGPGGQRPDPLDTQGFGSVGLGGGLFHRSDAQDIGRADPVGDVPGDCIEVGRGLHRQSDHAAGRQQVTGGAVGHVVLADVQVKSQFDGGLHPVVDEQRHPVGERVLQLCSTLRDDLVGGVLVPQLHHADATAHGGVDDDWHLCRSTTELRVGDQVEGPVIHRGSPIRRCRWRTASTAGRSRRPRNYRGRTPPGPQRSRRHRRGRARRRLRRAGRGRWNRWRR